MNLTLSPSELSDLKIIQRNVAGTPCYAKVTCILMLAKNCPPSCVSDFLGIDTSTVYRYLATFTSGGIDSLLETRHKGYWGMLDCQQMSALRTELKTHLYTETKSICNWLNATFGIEYTPQGAVDLLNRIGFTYKKTKEVPCEADASKQPTVSGHDRVNINGLLNAYDVTDVIALDQERINAQSTKELYQAALEKHPEAACIYIISDNARYYRNKELTQWVNGTRINYV